MKKFILHIIIACMATCLFGINASYAQLTNKYIRKGNKLYEQKNYSDAEAEYKKALSKDDKSSTGFFNLGNSLYEQKRYDQAMEQYLTSAKNSSVKADQAAAQYNVGNTYMEGKKWEDAINSYKQSLIKNPSDNQARYNLAYAQAMLKKQQNGGGGKNNNQQNKDKNKDKNKSQDQKNQNKDQQNKDQDKNNQQDKEDQQQQHPQPQPSNINQQRADQLLNAASMAEKKLRQDKDKKAKGVPVYKGKGW